MGAVDKQVQELEQAAGHQRRQELSDDRSRKGRFLQLLGSAELPVDSNCIFFPRKNLPVCAALRKRFSVSSADSPTTPSVVQQ